MDDKSGERRAAAASMQPEQRRSGFRTLVGYRTIAWTDGYAEIELVTGPEHLNSLGFVHGGVYATLLDAALGHAATWVSVQGNVRRSVTLSLTTTYLAPARSGRLVATARLRAIERRVGTLDGEVSDASGKLVAIGQASFRYERGSERTQGVPRR